MAPHISVQGQGGRIVYATCAIIVVPSSLERISASRFAFLSEEERNISLSSETTRSFSSSSRTRQLALSRSLLVRARSFQAVLYEDCQVSDSRLVVSRAARVWSNSRETFRKSKDLSVSGLQVIPLS